MTPPPRKPLKDVTMHSLIVVSHPSPAALTHAVAAEIDRAIAAGSSVNSVEIADLSQEGFDPRFSLSDIAAFNLEAPLADDARAEQVRIERAANLILVYPVYWWSMPGLLKGWIDRVFTNGWAYDESADGKVEKKLGWLRVHLVAICAAGPEMYKRRGYSQAMTTQIDQGIFDYCGAPVLSSDMLSIPQVQSTDEILVEARRIGARIGAGQSDRDTA
jgi:NAD(P)H dehydrogenase (quinone)